MGVAVLTGCTSSKEDVSIAKASRHGKPGFVRLLNLSSESVSMVDRGRQMMPPVATNVASLSFTTFPSGERTLQLKGKSANLNIKMNLNPEGSVLIVLGSNGKNSSIIEDPRVPKDGHNLKLIYLDPDGSVQSGGPSVTLANSGAHIVISAPDTAVAVPAGS